MFSCQLDNLLHILFTAVFGLVFLSKMLHCLTIFLAASAAFHMRICHVYFVQL